MIKSTAISAFGGGKTDDSIAASVQKETPAISIESPPPQVPTNATKAAKEPANSKSSSETKPKPAKVPPINEDTRKVLSLVLSGNTKIHYYDETLSTLASIKNQSLSEGKKECYKK